MNHLNLEEIKQKVFQNIDSNRNKYIEISKKILNNPESGYREYKTAKTVTDELSRIGIPYEDKIDLTGVKAILEGPNPGPTIAIIGELDSNIVKAHPYSDKNTGAAHACGHNIQIGIMLAIANAIKSSNVMQHLFGKIIFIAVPAEEYIEIEYRNQLRESGSIEFLVGKSEFVKLGEFDDIDIAMMTHTAGKQKGIKFEVGGTFNGMIAKLISFKGVASHAGSAPYLGVNALYASNIALSAINAQRETFREEDTIRIHPIITRGGEAVSAIPDDVGIETFIRGKTIDAIISASKKVDRSIKAGALAMGGSVDINTIPGFLPLHNNDLLQEIYLNNLDKIVKPSEIKQRGHETGSSDMGDLSNLIPIIHPFVSVATGKGHGLDYLIEDYELAIADSSKSMAGTVIDLMYNNGIKGKEVKEKFNPVLTKKEYLSLLRSFSKIENYSEGS